MIETPDHAIAGASCLSSRYEELESILLDLGPSFSQSQERVREFEVAIECYAKSLGKEQNPHNLFFGRRMDLPESWEENYRGTLLILRKDWTPAILVRTEDSGYSEFGKKGPPARSCHYQPFAFQIFDSSPTERTTYGRYLITLARKTSRASLRSLGSFLILSWLSMVPALVLQRIAQASDNEIRPHLLQFYIVLFCYLVTLPFYSWLYTIMSASSYVSIERDIIPLIWHKCLRLPIARWRQAESKELEESVFFAQDQKQFITAVLFPIVVACFQIGWSIAIIAFQGRREAIGASLFLFARIVMLAAAAVWRQGREVRAWKTEVEWRTFARRVFLGILTVRSHYFSEGVKQRWVQLASQRIDATAALKTITSLSVVMNSSATILYLSLWIAFVQPLHKSAPALSPRTVLFYAIFLQLMNATAKIETASTSLAKGKVASKRMEPLLSLSSASDLDRREFINSIEQLEMRGVSFGYQKGSTLFKGLSLSLRKGEILAVTGPSGSGKSTLVRLLLGMEAPIAGEIRLNDRPLSQTIESSFRRKCAVVFQDSFPIGRDVREAIANGRSLSDSEVWQALKCAALDEEVMRMPLRLLTPIGYRGALLSGGQRQRLLIAGAFARRSEILVLDESMSAVDNHAAETIVNAVRQSGALAIIVAHRCDALKDVSKTIAVGVAESREIDSNSLSAPLRC